MLKYLGMAIAGGKRLISLFGTRVKDSVMTTDTLLRIILIVTDVEREAAAVNKEAGSTRIDGHMKLQMAFIRVREILIGELFSKDDIENMNEVVAGIKDAIRAIVRILNGLKKDTVKTED